MKRLINTGSGIVLLLVALTLGTFGTQALADGKKGNKIYVVGVVESIDLQQKTFTVTNQKNEKTVVVVAPHTEFEIERGKDSMGDFYAKFADLQVNDWVKVKSYQTMNAGPVAKEVDIYR